MSGSELRTRRLALGYSVALLAEILQIPATRLEAWESDVEPVENGDELRLALRTLATQREDLNHPFVA